MAHFPFRLASIGTAALLTLLTLPLLEAARGSESVDTSQRAYKLVILDSLGGNSGANGVNDRGWLAGSSYLTGNQIQHATLWTLKPNRLIDLGTLGGPNSYVYNFTDDRGLIAGYSDTTTPDPLGENFCGFNSGKTCEGALWGYGPSLIALPPLAGGNNSQAFDANNRGQIAGESETATREGNPNCAPQILEYEAAIWEPLNRKHISALPPVTGDADSQAFVINDNGDAAGASGFCNDQLHPVLWRHGKTVALPTLGGTTANVVNGINARGELVGQSGVPGNATVHAAFWKTPKTVVDLGTFPGDSYSLLFGINDEGQIVGASGNASTQRAALWQNGVVYDLNTLIPPNSRYSLMDAIAISDSGIIAGGAYDAKTGVFVSFAAVPTGLRPDRTSLSAVRPVALPPSVIQRIRQHGLRRFL